MVSSPAPHSRAACRWHLGGAVLLLSLILVLVERSLAAPVDLFVHHDLTTAYDLTCFAVLGAGFYGFSLVLLWLRPLSAGWGALYAVGSWLLFVLTFFPTRPTSGIMRRTADLANEERLRSSVHEGFVTFSFVVLLAFALVQMVFLFHTVRAPSVRNQSLPPASP